MKVVIYARVSTQEQATHDKGSIEDQIERCKKAIDEHGWELIGAYQDIQKGHEIETRKNLLELLKDARDKKFDLVIFRDADRLSRDRANATILREQLKDLLIQTYSIDQPKEPVPPEEYDPDLDDSGVIYEGFADIKADLDIKSLRRKIRQGAKNRALRGEPHDVPYGYDKRYTQHQPIVKFDVLINKKQVKVVIRIFDSYGNKDLSLRRIMRDLNTEGIPSPTNVLWSTGTIKKILTNPFYTGYIRHNHRPVKRKTRIVSNPKDWIMVKSDHIPAIIDEKLFQNVQKRLKQRYVLHGRALASNGLLIGLAKCGYCGRNLYYKTNNRKRGKNGIIWHSYICWAGTCFGNNVACKAGSGYLMEAKKLEGKVINYINSLVQNPKLKKEFLKRTDSKEKQKSETLLRQAQTTLNKLIKAEERLWIAYEGGYTPLKEFGERKAELQNKKIEIETQIKLFSNQVNKQLSEIELKQQKIKFLKEFKNNFEKADLTIRKKILQGLIKEIKVSKNQIKIDFLV